MIAMNGSSGLIENRRLLLQEQQESVTSNDLVALVEQQDFKCALTGRPLTPDIASVDHVVPLARGGGNSIGNLAVVHADANTAKGTMTRDEFVQMCREVVAYADKIE